MVWSRYYAGIEFVVYMILAIQAFRFLGRIHSQQDKLEKRKDFVFRIGFISIGKTTHLELQ